jgi:hypothetical protein
MRLFWRPERTSLCSIASPVYCLCWLGLSRSCMPKAPQSGIVRLFRWTIFGTRRWTSCRSRQTRPPTSTRSVRRLHFIRISGPVLTMAGRSVSPMSRFPAHRPSTPPRSPNKAKATLDHTPFHSTLPSKVAATAPATGTSSRLTSTTASSTRYTTPFRKPRVGKAVLARSSTCLVMRCVPLHGHRRTPRAWLFSPDSFASTR